MNVIKAAFVYFGIVFSMGFMLGALRTFWVAPRLGSRSAELLEMPVMLVVTLLAARWVSERVAVSARRSASIGIGLLALGLLIVAEVLVGVTLQRTTVVGALVKPDPISGAAYYASLVVFVIAPWIMSRRSPVAAA